MKENDISFLTMEKSRSQITPSIKSFPVFSSETSKDFKFIDSFGEIQKLYSSQSYCSQMELRLLLTKALSKLTISTL